MENSDFYKIKQSLNRQKETPPEFVWARIEQEIPTYESQRRLVPFWLRTMLLTGLILGALLITMSIHKSEAGAFISEANHTKESIAKGLLTNDKNNYIALSESSIQPLGDKLIDVQSKIRKAYQSNSQNEKNNKITKSNENENIQIAGDETIATSKQIDFNESSKGDLTSILDIPLLPNNNINHTELISINSLPIIEPKQVIETTIIPACKIAAYEPQFSRKIILKQQNWIEGLSLGLNTGYYKDKRRMSTKIGESANIMGLQEKSVKPWYGVQLSAEASIKLNSGVVLMIGLDHLRSVFTFDHESQSQVNSLAGYKITTKRTVRDTNSVSTFDIPIKIGYFKKIGRWEIGAASGILWNTNVIARGRRVNQLLQIENYSSTYSNYEHNIGIGFTGEVRTSYLINRVLAGTASVGYRMYPNSWTSGNLSYNEYYNKLSILVGLRYDFNFL